MTDDRELTMSWDSVRTTTETGPWCPQPKKHHFPGEGRIP